MKKMLIVEDDQNIARGLADAFTAEHFSVRVEHDGEKGFLTAKRTAFDLIILDLMLPSMNGVDICRKLREEEIQTPVVMLTSKGTEIDKVMGLEMGADDYVTKPFSIRELTARVHALLRRQTALVTELQECAFDDVHVDFTKQEARRGRQTLDMTVREFQLLKYFVEREGRVISRAQLLDDVWGYEATPTTRTVDNYILSLRKKIERKPSAPEHLVTIHTAGYKFVSKSSPPIRRRRE